MMLNGELRIKRILSEIRYNLTPVVNDYKWQYLEENKKDLSGFGNLPRTNGILIVKEGQSLELELEMDRSSFLIENIKDNINSQIERIYLNFGEIVKKNKIQMINRFGFRIFYLLKIKEFNRIEEYAKTMFDKSKELFSDMNITSVENSGFIVRFQRNECAIRFGTFSVDDEVIKKYHKYHKNKEFLGSAIMLDIDISKKNINNINKETFTGVWDL